MTSKVLSGLAIAAIASTALAGAALAEDGGIDTASGGNGGVSSANANGGPVSIGSTIPAAAVAAASALPSTLLSPPATTSPRR